MSVPTGITASTPFSYDGDGIAYSGNDVRAFVLPTYDMPGIFQSPSNIDLSNAQSCSWGDKTAIDSYLNQGYITNIVGISVSTHRDKFPVVSLGRMDPSGFVGSRRTVAGTLVFYLLNVNPISQLLTPNYQKELPHADELPPFDLYLTFMTAEGMWSACVIYGITILDEGMVIENSNADGITITYSYMALDCTPVTPGYFVLPKSNNQNSAQDNVTIATGTITNTGNATQSVTGMTVSTPQPVEQLRVPIFNNGTLSWKPVYFGGTPPGVPK